MPKITLQELDKEIRSKSVRSVYLIYGAENYLVNTSVARIRDYVSKLCGEKVEPERYSSKDIKPAELVNSLQTIPMWTKCKLVIVSDAEGIKDPSALIAYVKKPSESSVLVLTAASADGRTKFVQTLNESAGVIECKPLYDNQVPDWIRMEVSNRGKMISREASVFMLDVVGKNLGELSSSIDKLILYVGAKPAIDLADVETVLTETNQKSVFEFANAVGARDLKKSLHILERLKEFSESEVVALNILSRHWRLLLKARETISSNPSADLAKILGVHPFFAKDYASQARQFNASELKRGFKQLYKTDKLIKSSRLSKWLLLEKCVMELTKA